ncbi:hypothetical protein Fcan01_08183 [Folsomia candida]|uniref:Uncharacterized protein n=1 Tax=Folsomia candida TaxID=158441 RepID=A0A226EPD0_FOLCA|nr:hypothetical protein Fcan01_08183 [Folsomia candida]
MKKINGIGSSGPVSRLRSLQPISESWRSAKELENPAPVNQTPDSFDNLTSENLDLHNNNMNALNGSVMTAMVPFGENIVDQVVEASEEATPAPPEKQVVINLVANSTATEPLQIVSPLTPQQVMDAELTQSSHKLHTNFTAEKVEDMNSGNNKDLEIGQGVNMSSAKSVHHIPTEIEFEFGGEEKHPSTISTEEATSTTASLTTTTMSAEIGSTVQEEGTSALLQSQMPTEVQTTTTELSPLAIESTSTTPSSEPLPVTFPPPNGSETTVIVGTQDQATTTATTHANDESTHINNDTLANSSINMVPIETSPPTQNGTSIPQATEIISPQTETVPATQHPEISPLPTETTPNQIVTVLDNAITPASIPTIPTHVLPSSAPTEILMTQNETASTLSTLEILSPNETAQPISQTVLQNETVTTSPTPTETISQNETVTATDILSPNETVSITPTVITTPTSSEIIISPNDTVSVSPTSNETILSNEMTQPTDFISPNEANFLSTPPSPINLTSFVATTLPVTTETVPSTLVTTTPHGESIVTAISTTENETLTTLTSTQTQKTTIISEIETSSQVPTSILQASKNETVENATLSLTPIEIESSTVAASGSIFHQNDTVPILDLLPSVNETISEIFNTTQSHADILTTTGHTEPPSEKPTTDIPHTTTESNVPIFHEDYEDHLLQGGTSPGCMYEDRERFKRNLQATAFSWIHGIPTMLSFSRHTSCVGILQKNGTRSIKHLKKMFPEFPSSETSVETAAFIHDNVVLIDSSPAQRVWTYMYDQDKDSYKSMTQMSKSQFLEMCDIPTFSSHIKAFAQVSAQDPTCILFGDSREATLSSNATSEAVSLAGCIKFMLDKEFVTHVEAVFRWLDEPFITSIYVYGSDGELYRIFRNNLPGTLWTPGNYEVLQYSQFPLPRQTQNLNF